MANLEKDVVVNLMYGGNWVMEKFNNYLKNYDLSVQQYNILRILRGQKGLPINLCMLQDHMIHKMSNTSRLIDKLVIKKYVIRKVCEYNRRKIEITITNKGLELLDELDYKITALEKDMVVTLSKSECENLIILIKKLINN